MERTQSSTASKEEQPRLSEPYLTLVKGIESIADYAIFLLDSQDRVATWNKGVERIKGYTADGIIGQSFTKFYKSEAVAEHYPEHVLQTAKDKGLFEDEGWGVRKDGSTFWANVVITPLYNEQHKHIGFMKVSRDLTERKCAERLLAESEQHYRTLTTLTPGGIFYVNPADHLRYVNARACQLMGLSEQEVQAKSWFTAPPPDDKELVLSAWNQALQQATPFNREFQFKHADGQVRWVLSQAISETDASHHILSYVQMLTDITERKTFEEKERFHLITLQRAQEERRRIEAEEQKRKLAAYIHTICQGMRNPITGIYGSNAFIKTGLQAIQNLLHQKALQSLNEIKKTLHYLQELESYIQSIEECVTHQKVMVDDILNSSHLEAHRMEANRVPVQLKELIHSIVSMFKGEAARKGLKIILKLPEKAFLVKTALHYFSQILTNLIYNAIKFITTGQIIGSIRTEEDVSQPSCIQVQVEDTGVEMPEMELVHIKPFSQANKNIIYQYGNSGLGLFISKRLAELSGGTISATSQRGKGAQFTFTVRCEPVTEDEKTHFRKQEEPVIAQVIPKKLNLTKPILLIDDNAINRKLTRRILEQKNYSYQEAASGKEAFSKWQPHDFAFTLMEVEMPQMNGLEAIQCICQQEQEIGRDPTSIGGIAGNAHQEQITAALQAGMNNYLVKPFTKAQLYTSIQKWAKKAIQAHPSSNSVTLICFATNSSTEGLEKNRKNRFQKTQPFNLIKR